MAPVSAMQRQPGTTGGKWPHRILPLVVACFAFSGCSVMPRADLELAASGPEPVVLESVPFYPQTEYQCGPAALAGLLGSSGVTTSPEALSPQVFLPERQGSLQVELMAATRRAGRIPYPLPGELEALANELQSNRPVLVLQNLRTRSFPVWHYAVLVGMDPGANRVYLNSGTAEQKSMRARTFMRTWNWAERWAMVALKPGELPATPEPLTYYQAAASFASVANASDAEQAWQAAAARWPDDHRPEVALGNLAFGQDDFENAVRHYTRGLKLNPDNAVLENNLAEATAAAGCPAAAEQRLARFLEQLEPASPWKGQLQETLAELQARPTRTPADNKTCQNLAGPQAGQATKPSSPRVK